MSEPVSQTATIRLSLFELIDSCFLMDIAKIVASQELRVLEDKQQGCYCVAARDIDAGTLLAACEPAAAALDAAHRSSRCHVCYSKVDELTECTGCNLFAACAQCTLAEHTTAECALLELADCSSSVLLAFRLALRYLDERGDWCNSSSPVAALQHNSDCFLAEQIAEYSAVAQHLTALLLATTSTGADAAAVQQRVLQLVCVCALNAHAIMDPQEHTVIGQGVFPALSFFNHSCCPTAYFAATYTPGHSLQAAVRARQPLTAGAAVTLSYIPLNACPSSARQQQLRAQYGFSCSCEQCSSCSMDAVVSAVLPDATADDCAFEAADTEEVLTASDELTATGRYLEAHLLLASQLQSLQCLGSTHWLRLRLLLSITHCQVVREKFDLLGATCDELLAAMRQCAPLVEPLLRVQTLVYRAVACGKENTDDTTSSIGSSSNDSSSSSGGAAVKLAVECLQEAHAILTACLGSEHAYTNAVSQLLQQQQQQLTTAETVRDATGQ
jgi:SET domain